VKPVVWLEADVDVSGVSGAYFDRMERRELPGMAEDWGGAAVVGGERGVAGVLGSWSCGPFRADNALDGLRPRDVAAGGMRCQRSRCAMRRPAQAPMGRRRRGRCTSAQRGVGPAVALGDGRAAGVDGPSRLGAGPGWAEPGARGFVIGGRDAPGLDIAVGGSRGVFPFREVRPSTYGGGRVR
jgi:hypothetical protein